MSAYGDGGGGRDGGLGQDGGGGRDGRAGDARGGRREGGRGDADKEAAVRRLLDTPHPPVPGDLGRTAAERGARLLRRDRAVRRAAWTLVALGWLAFLLWAWTARPWEVPPAATTPPFDGL